MAYLKGNSRANTILGTNDGDYIDGRRGNDTLVGGNGADTLVGGGGNDWLSGGKGADTLTGGRGKDVFVFNPWDTRSDWLNGQYDRITDFKPGYDQIALNGRLGVGSMVFHDVEGDTLVKFDGHTILRIEGVSNDALQASDFG